MIRAIVLCSLGACVGAFNLPSTRVGRREALQAAAVAFVAPPMAASANMAENKLQDLLDEKIKSQEASLGITFDANDKKELETILRNKYCGKAGLYSAMEGGTCRENYDIAVYCPSGGQSMMTSGAAGCPVAKPPRPPREPPKAPTLPSLPSLPF